MKAEEARQIAVAARTGKIEEIYKGIELAAKRGDYFTHVYFLIHRNDKSQLEADGFKIADVSERNETCINISWE
jgi:hypothetical protein